MTKSMSIANHSVSYAARTDFCRIFVEEMNELFLLALLLTADFENAEKCFICSFEEASESWSVFKDWARGWARHLIIQNAIRLHISATMDPSPPSVQSERTVMEAPTRIKKVLHLPTPERFVFVLSFLERLTDQECSLLLRCTRHEVIGLRIRALCLLADTKNIENHDARFISPHLI